MTSTFSNGRNHEVTLTALLGLKMPGGYLYDVCVPGALNPWLFEIPEKWVPKGWRRQPLLTLEESYVLTPTSYRHEPINPEKPEEGTRKISWLDQARELKHWELIPPPPDPGFWDALHARLSTSESWSLNRMQRSVGGMLGWLGARGATKEVEELKAKMLERGVQL